MNMNPNYSNHFSKTNFSNINQYISSKNNDGELRVDLIEIDIRKKYSQAAINFQNSQKSNLEKTINNASNASKKSGGYDEGLQKLYSKINTLQENNSKDIN